MAYGAFNGSTQYLSQTSGPVSDFPMTMGCWIYVTDTTSDHQYPLTCRNFSVQHQGWSLQAFSDALVYFSNKGNTAEFFATASYTANAWIPVIGIAHSSSSQFVYVSGNTDGEQTSGCGPVTTAPDRTFIAATVTNVPGVGNFFDGRIAEAFIDNVAWSAEERAAFEAGVSPMAIRPTVAWYKPIISDLEWPHRGAALTNNASSPVIEHPPIVYRRRGFGGWRGTVSSGQNKARMTISGTAKEINAALPSLTLTPTTDYTGTVMLTMVSTTSTPLSDTDIIQVVVSEEAGVAALSSCHGINFSVGLHF